MRGPRGTYTQGYQWLEGKLGPHLESSSDGQQHQKPWKLWCLFLSDHSSFPNCLSFSKYHLYFHFLKYYSQCSNLLFLCNSLEFTDSRIFHLKLKLYPFCTLKSLGPPVLLHSWLNSTVWHTDEILHCPCESGSFPLSVHSDFMHIEHVLDCNDMLIFPLQEDIYPWAIDRHPAVSNLATVNHTLTALAYEDPLEILLSIPWLYT